MPAGASLTATAAKRTSSSSQPGPRVFLRRKPAERPPTAGKWRRVRAFASLVARATVPAGSRHVARRSGEKRPIDGPAQAQDPGGSRLRIQHRGARDHRSRRQGAHRQAGCQRTSDAGTGGPAGSAGSRSAHVGCPRGGGGRRSRRGSSGRGGPPSQVADGRHLLSLRQPGRQAAGRGRTGRQGRRGAVHHRGDEDHERDRDRRRRLDHQDPGRERPGGGIRAAACS